MKKYIFKTVLSLMLALPFMTSCELTQYPEGQIPAEEAWQQMSDAENFYIGLKAALRANVGGSRAYVSEVQADLFNGKIGLATMTRVHEWSFSTSQFEGDVVWSGGFYLTSVANNIINNIDQVETEDPDDAKRIDEIKGAALFCRAYAYTCMVQRYCVNYDPATAANELGLPLVTEVDVNGKPARANLQQTFDFILKDIADAKTLISDNAGADEPNKDALTALSARVNLLMKNYDEAISDATSLFRAYPLTEADDYEALWLSDEGSEIILQPQSSPDEQYTGWGAFIGYDVAQNAYSANFLPTQGLMDMYERADVRKCFFLQENVSALDKVAQAYIFYKFPGNPNLRKPNETDKDTWVNMTKVFRTSEMYLIAAEASLFKATPDEDAARGYLNTLRTARNASTLTSTGAKLVKDMKEEWVREMVGEGFRLDCLKRWGDPIVRMTPQSLPDGILITNPNDAYLGLNVQPGSELYYKIIWEIPTQDTQANGNLEPNWK